MYKLKKETIKISKQTLLISSGRKHSYIFRLVGPAPQGVGEGSYKYNIKRIITFLYNF
jgi:hypothetical protein